MSTAATDTRAESPLAATAKQRPKLWSPFETFPSPSEFPTFERNFIRRVRTDAAMASPSIVSADPPFATGPLARLADCDFWGWDHASPGDVGGHVPLSMDACVSDGKQAAGDVQGAGIKVVDWERVRRVLKARQLAVQSEWLMMRVEEEQAVYRSLMTLFDDLQSTEHANSDEELAGLVLEALSRQREYIGVLRKTRREAEYTIKQLSQLLSILSRHRLDPDI